jgi:hypothetical protein
LQNKIKQIYVDRFSRQHDIKEESDDDDGDMEICVVDDPPLPPSSTCTLPTIPVTCSPASPDVTSRKENGGAPEKDRERREEAEEGEIVRERGRFKLSSDGWLEFHGGKTVTVLY